MDLKFVRFRFEFEVLRLVNAMVGGEREGWVKGRAGERRQRVKAPVKSCAWPMQFPTAPIWHPHKGKAGVFLTALRVRRRPVEDRASAKKRGGSASGIPLPGSENFLAVNINGAPAPFILPGLTEIFLTRTLSGKSKGSPCAPEVLGWLRGVHPRLRPGL